ncbi:hypothetical protein UFOVP317_20 [uncultured Caudovirales phage]|uniref:Uncharacterized protein n=1 Tax=uncultured Caudovirales phage TaxID=2100421 RepID=A0A6J5LS84_9CAUD|nr:hypothetical protein UFOVP317_20 [uncultured Caudovirales phage]
MVDPTTQAALEAPILHWRMLLYADFQGDVLRATSGIYDKVISGTGDAELDGTYQSLDHNLIEISPVKHNESGSDTVTVSLNGILAATEFVQDRFESFVEQRDNDFIQIRGSSLLNILGDITRWQGRTARLWFYVVDENENQIGSIIPYYTGYMDDITIAGSPSAQRISLSIENYLVTLSGASNKGYLSQSQYDVGDNSAAATISAANGLVGGVISGGGGGGGGGGRDAPTGREMLP